MTPSNVVDFNDLKAAAFIAEQFKVKMSSEIDKARREGCRLDYRLGEEEQIGRGVIFFAEVRLVPTADSAKRKFSRCGHAYAVGRADYEDPADSFDALKDAVDKVFELAATEGVIS